VEAAEFRAIREFIGASQHDIADGLCVQTRSVKRWERGINRIPEDVEEYMRKLEQNFEQAVDLLEDNMEDGKKDWRLYRTQEEYCGHGFMGLEFYAMWNKAVTLADWLTDNQTVWRYSNE
jgi:transcriptional regulator with XRE-family HTH domain